MFRNSVVAFVCFALCTGVAEAQAASQPCTVEPDAKKKTDLTSVTQAAMAADWNDSTNVEYTLRALGYMTLPNRKDGFLDVRPDLARETLQKTSLAHADLYKAAFHLPSFLDWLATANTLVSGKPNHECSQYLFDTSATLILEIFGVSSNPAHPKRESGAKKIVGINNLFAQKSNYAALYLLLRAVPAPAPGDKITYVKKLEILRSAFATDPDRLAALVKKQIASE